MIALAGVAAGIALFLAFRQFMDRTAVREWKRKRRAYVLGLYLFGDDPSISLRGLARIARANAFLLLHALPALAIAAPLVGAAGIALDRSMARASIEASRAAVVTAHWKGACEPRLETTAWLQVDSPPVRVPALEEISWRVRVMGKSIGAVRVGCGGERVNAEVSPESPQEPWLGWFGVIAWATAWLLGLFAKLF